MEHGCSDLSLTIDLSQFSSAGVSFEGSNDDQQVETKAGVIVAVRLLRLQTLQEGGEKTEKVRVSTFFQVHGLLSLQPAIASSRPAAALVESKTRERSRAARRGLFPGPAGNGVASDG